MTIDDRPGSHSGAAMTDAGSPLPSPGEVGRRGFWPGVWVGVAGLGAVLLAAHRAVAQLPMTAATPLLPLASLFDLCLLAMLLLLTHTAGARALRALGLVMGRVEGVAFATALGLGLGAYTALALAFLGLYRPPVLLAMVVGAAALLHRDLLATATGLMQAVEALRRPGFRSRLPVPAPVMGLLATIIVAATAGVFTIPQSWDFLTIRLAAPLRWLIDRRVPEVLDINWSQPSLIAELLYRFGLAIGCACLAALVGVVRRPCRGGPLALALVALLGATFLPALLAALAPPHHWDPLTYHLTAPQRFLLTGWIAPLPEIEWSNLPLTAELLYGVGLAFGSEAFGQLLHFAFAALTAAALWALADRCFDRLTAWLAVAVFAAMPQVPIWAHVANVDLALACFLFLAVAAALRADEGADGNGQRPRVATDCRRWLGLAGVFAGLALGTKYQAMFAVAPLTLLVLLDGWRRRRVVDGAGPAVRSALVRAGHFAGIAALVASPWYLKNWLLLGNPVWPLIFGGRGFSAEALELTNYWVDGMVLAPRDLTGYLLLPLRIYTRGDFELRPAVILSPLFLLLPALVVLPPRRELLYLLGVSAGFAAGWALGFQELRYLLPVCAPLSLATAYLLRAAWARARLRPLVVAALVGSALITQTVVGLLVDAEGPISVVFGRLSRDAYLRPNAGYQALDFLARQMQPGETALLVHEAELFYFPPSSSVRTDHLNLNLILLTEAHPDPPDALAAMQAEGIDYLLANEGSVRFWRRFDTDDRLDRAMRVYWGFVPYLENLYWVGEDWRTDTVVYRLPRGPIAEARGER